MGDRLADDVWLQALENYFATPQSTHTLADLCSRFDTFQHSALDRYKQPIRAIPSAIHIARAPLSKSALNAMRDEVTDALLNLAGGK